MKIADTSTTIKKQLESKQARLEKIAVSDYPIDPKKVKVHKRKVLNANNFINELEEITGILDFGLNIKLVPRPTFEKQVAKADFASMEFDGEFCKIALIQNYPYDNLWLVYTAAVESI